jgi:trans-aconitate methyltransferase
MEPKSVESVDGWNGEEYLKNTATKLGDTIEFILSSYNFKGTEKVLDIGCGPGQISDHFASILNGGGSVVGIDVSQEMIRCANQVYAGGNGGNLSFKVQRAEEIDYTAEFDVIYSTFCFHYVEDKELAFKRIYEALKEGGTLILVTTVWGRNLFNEARHNLMKEEPWQTLFRDSNIPRDHPSTPAIYVQLATAAGLAIAETKLKTTEIIFEDWEKAKTFYVNSTPQLAAIAEPELKEKFILEHMARTLSKKREENGEEVYVYERDIITLVATKNKP